MPQFFNLLSDKTSITWVVAGLHPIITHLCPIWNAGHWCHILSEAVRQTQCQLWSWESVHAWPSWRANSPQPHKGMPWNMCMSWDILTCYFVYSVHHDSCIGFVSIHIEFKLHVSISTAVYHAPCMVTMLCKCYTKCCRAGMYVLVQFALNSLSDPELTF